QHFWWCCRCGGDPGGCGSGATDSAEDTEARTFVEPGDVLYGCHQPGHYDAGMVGVIEVTP
ncbi:MAG TPA: hypothetical protein VK923_04015, partial [Euzebyales bacterium]|nr:hypothetical protein [Euzebyales bacterium]